MWLRIGNSLARFRKARKGVAAVEFALVAGPLLFVIGSILETGVMLFTEYQLQNAVQKASRLIRIGQVSSATVAMSRTQFVQEFCNGASGLRNCNTSLNLYVQNAADFSTLATTAVAPLTVGPATTTFSPGVGGRAVLVIATYDWRFIFPFMSMFANTSDRSVRRLQGITTFRNEPF